MTFGTDLVASGQRDQFLEVLPSEQLEGGLKIHFAGTEAGSSNDFDNPVTAFGFYLMGREIKRDVYLDVYNTEGALIYSKFHDGAWIISVRLLWNTSPSRLTIQDEFSIETIHLREEIASGDTAARRDIFSIDNLVVQFGDELAGEDSGDAGDGGDTETIYVGPGSTTAPHYTFYSDEPESLSVGILFSILTPITSLSGSAMPHRTHSS